MHLTLRTKGVLALSVLVLYVVLVGVFLTQEQKKSFQLVQQIESNHYHQAFLASVFNGLTHSLVETQAMMSSGNYPATYAYHPLDPWFANNLDPIIEGLARVRQLYPVLEPEIGRLGRAVDAAKALGNARHLDAVRNSEQVLIAKLNDIRSGLQSYGADLTQRYHGRQQFISAVSVAANIAGVVVSVAVILIFFTRLAADIKNLQDRAAAVVGGYDGEPLSNTRHDEVGGLIDAVNRMQVDLRRWEQQQEMSRQQRFHQEKMAAVGSLAAGIAHEVSNPIAAIAGITQLMVDETKDDNRKMGRVHHDFAAQILKQTERIALILRQMAAMTAPHSPDPELLDLNALIRTTCSFIAFDKRFAGIELEQDLDRDLPAVTAVADHITQILMNLLINAADAMDPAREPGRSRIRIVTRMAGGEIQISVNDNGHGMSSEVLGKAFDESFTTKPTGKGRGIGLFLCKNLMDKASGRIELASTPGVGTSVHLFLPLHALDNEAN